MANREEWISGKKRNFENPLDHIISGALSPIVKNRSKLEADLILNWNKIFDANIGSKIFLKKIINTDKKNNKFILHINTKAADYLEISYATEVIKEQLHVFLGYNGAEKIFVHKLD